MSEYVIDMGNSIYQSQSGLVCADVLQLKEEIVRCRDCKYYSDEFKYTDDSMWCDHHDNFINSEGFCAWGVRK